MDDQEETGQVPRVDALLARQIAELVSGFRGEPFWIVVTMGDEHGQRRNRRFIRKVNHDPGPVPGALVIPCFTPERIRRPDIVEASITPEGGDRVDLLNLVDDRGRRLGRGDAVFWTQSAVEKFVVPYYASVGGERAGLVVTVLMNLFQGIPGTSPDKEGKVEKRARVFGLVHMPKSEYIEPTAGDVPGTELGVLRMQEGTGGYTLTPLSDLMEEEEAPVP